MSALKQICSSRAAKRVEVDASVNDASGLDVCLFRLLPEGEVSGPRAIGVDDVAVKEARAGENEDSRSCGDWLGATSWLLEDPWSNKSSSSIS